VKAYFLHHLEARPWQAFLEAEEGRKAFAEVGAERNASLMQCLSGATLAALGDGVSAETLLREALAASIRTEQPLVGAQARQFLIPVLAQGAEPAHWQEACELAHAYMMVTDAEDTRRGVGYSLLAQALLASGRPGEAEVTARKACELLVHFLTYQVLARTVLTRSLLAQGRGAEARQVAEVGVRELERMDNAGVDAAGMYLALTEACFAEGEAGAGESALRQALRCVRARASDIPDAALRERFLGQVPENARTLELAHQRWGEPLP
jgi:eukaryotic-like serine/threonine-protein kinase